MTALNVGVPTAPAVAPAISAAFGLRIFTGLVGVLLAVLVSGFNENVTKVAMPDIRGAMGISYDDSTWLLAVYSATSISAMAFAPWCAATFSLRRFTLCAIGAFLLLGILCPLAPNVEVLMLLRTNGSCPFRSVPGNWSSLLGALRIYAFSDAADGLVAPRMASAEGLVRHACDSAGHDQQPQGLRSGRVR